MEALRVIFSILFTNAFWFVKSMQHNVNQNSVLFSAAYHGNNQNYKQLIDPWILHSPVRQRKLNPKVHSRHVYMLFFKGCRLAAEGS